MLKMSVLRTFGRAALFCVCHVARWAQMSQITGRVVDKSEAAVPDAQLTAANTRTGIARTVTCVRRCCNLLILVPNEHA